MGKKVKFYIDTDVYTEAKKRINHILDIFDSVLVCFSGGKDSLTTLCLTEEVYRERGIKEKIKVVFRDEEIIPDDVLAFVQEKAESGKYDFRYYAIPLESNKFVMGQTFKYVQWDKNRQWLRQPPKYAITLPENEYHEYSQYDADTFICKNEKGKVALLTGIRADESLLRLRSCINKRNENYINDTKDLRIKICKPIYDWTEQDVFVYFFRNKIKYCPIYDLQTINGDGLRVSTPLHAESSKRFYKLKTLYPTFYQQIIDLFPDMILQSRYWQSLAKGGKFESDGYEHSFDGLRKFATDTITDPHELKKAITCIDSAEVMRRNNLAQGKRTNSLGGYPLRYVLKQIENGAYKRGVFLPQNGTPSKEDLDFERA